MPLLCVALPSDTIAASGFSKRLELHGFSFDISSINDGLINQLSITPHGLAQQNDPVVVEIDGAVSGAEIADLDSSGFPEIYIYVTSVGSGSYGSLVGCAVSNGASMTEIYLPPVADNAKYNDGYMGHDEFALVEGTFVQRFPIYKGADSNAEPTGKTRQLQYKLKAGEAGWLLKLAKVIEY